MSEFVLQLPWTGRSVPHGTLEIVKGCNIVCRGCYNNSSASPHSAKPLELISWEIDRLLALREIHTITLTGGEPFLHPDLPEIVKHLRQRRLRVAILTNGLNLNESFLGRLRQAGLDILFLHVDEGQTRPDLSEAADVRRLRRRLTAMAQAAHLNVGWSMTVYRNTVSAFSEAVGDFLEADRVDYFFVTGFSDYGRFGRLSGTMSGGFRQIAGTAWNADSLEVEAAELRQILSDNFHWQPYAGLNSTHDSRELRWTSYLAAIARMPGRKGVCYPVKASRADSILVRIGKILYGRYVFYLPYRTAVFRLHLCINSLGHLMVGRKSPGWELLSQSIFKGQKLVCKRLVIESRPESEPDGCVSFCRECPDATLRNGRLVPLCLADHVESD